MCKKCRQKREWFSTTARLKTCWERAFFGFVVLLRSAVRNQPSLTGQSNATEIPVASWRWLNMIKSDSDLEVTQDRIRDFERQVAQIRKTETDPENYRMSAA